MGSRRIYRIYSAAFILVLLATLIYPLGVVFASPPITVTPITWNVIGLDSNRPAEGPYEFPVGVRACNPNTNVVTFSDVEADFVWLDGGTSEDDTYIKLRPGSLDPIQPAPQIDLTPGNCYDFYFEVELNQIAGSFDQTRRYRIDVTYYDPDTGSRETSTSTTPRELYVEHLISQNRNSVNDVELDGVSFPVGGTMDLFVGETYTISMDASTATQGYEQIESFIHFPNTIFQVLSVNTNYSADSSAHVDNPNDKLYGNSCLWENDPDSPNYRSCLDVGKNGGTLRVDYVVKIISGAGTSDTLNSLIYDFSGSSYHYNADYSVSYRNFNIIGPSSIDINKRFIPDSITSGSSSTLSFTIPNPTPTTISGVNFTDPLPAGMEVNTPPNVSIIGCGTPTFAPAAGATILTFSGGEIAPNSSCLVKVDVTVASDGTYLNTTNNLFIDITTDTGNFASDTLEVGSVAACVPGQSMVVWTVPASTTNPPDQSSPVAGSPSSTGSKISTASVSVTEPARTDINNLLGVGDTYSWSLWGYKTPVQNVDFVLDTSSYSDISLTFYEQSDSNGPTSLTIYYDSGSGMTPHPTTPTVTPTAGSFASHTIDFTSLSNPGGNTTFRISGTGALNDNSGANLFLDNMSFTGCLESDPPPTITKSFGSDPITVNGTSTLTFTLANTGGAAVDLTGVGFSDLLPSGLEVASPPNASTTCAGSPTWAPLAGNTNLIFGTPAGATMAASPSCTLSVDITATAAGYFENISDYISSDQSGENKTSSGYATDTLTVVAPPIISKNFSDATILTGTTTTLSFMITNPNQTTALTGIGFSDTLPVGLDISSGPGTACGGTLSLLDNDPDEIVLSGGSLIATSNCSFTVTVTGITAGDQDNLTGTVASIEGGNGNTTAASIYIEAPDPKTKILKQIGLTNGPNNAWSDFLRIDSLPTDVYYKFIVENIGNVDLTSIRVFDPPGDYPGSPISCTFYYPEILPAPPVLYSDPLSPGEFIYCIPIGPTTVNISGSVTNTAKAYGDYSGSDYSFNESEAEYATPELTIDKTAAAPGYFAAEGDSLSYSYLVTNSGFVDLEGPITVSDDKTTVTCPGTNTVGDLDAYLDIGESLTCTASYTILAADVSNGEVVNVARASADGVTSETDTVTGPLAAYTIDKTITDVDGGGAGGSVDAAGDVISYQVVAENTGNYPLNGITLADTLVVGVGIPVESATADNILEVSETWTWTYNYTATQADINNNGGGDGDIDNTATVSSTELDDESDSEIVLITQTPALTLVKSITGGDPYDSVGDVIAYSFLVTNSGNVRLVGPVTINDDQATDESCPDVNTQGNLDTYLDPGESLTCTASYTVDQDDLNAGSVTNIADASAGGTTSPTDTQTADTTQIFDPPFGIKVYDDSGLPLLQWTMVWINDSDDDAMDAEVYDPIPGGTSYSVSGASSGSAVPGGAPAGSTNIGISCTTQPGSLTTTTLCYYEGPTGANPRGQIIWAGTLGPDQGATDAASADHELNITFRVNVDSGISSVDNNASIDADLNEDDVIDEDDGEIEVASAQAEWTRASLPRVPETGYEPGVITEVPNQPIDKQYQYYSDVRLEIPTLGLKTNIVGVPLTNGDWDVTWLTRQTGWLEGSAFPTHAGNSILTSHVYLPNGLPGPFVNLHQLTWDDQIIIYAYGQRYIYKVRTNTIIKPDDPTATKHEEYPWLTLLTCKGFNDTTDKYDYRVMIRAVLIDVQQEYFH